MMHEKQTKKPMFDLGRLLITPPAQSTLPCEDVMAALSRHITGDWGDCCKDDCKENELSLREGFRLFSVYHDRKGTKFWIITEAGRHATTILMPDDY